MSDLYILDESGKPVRIEDSDDVALVRRWADWMTSYAQRRVGLDVIHGITISTVYEGVDKRTDRTKPLTLWVTWMRADDLAADVRYASHDAAVAGHALWCTRVREQPVDVIYN